MLLRRFLPATSALSLAPHVESPKKGTHPLWNSRLKDHARGFYAIAFLRWELHCAVNSYKAYRDGKAP